MTELVLIASVCDPFAILCSLVMRAMEILQGQGVRIQDCEEESMLDIGLQYSIGLQNLYCKAFKMNCV